MLHHPGHHPYGFVANPGHHGSDLRGLTLQEAGSIAVRQLGAAPYLTLAGIAAGAVLAQRANKLLAAQSKKKRTTKLSRNQELGLMVGGVVLVNLTHIVSSLLVAAAD